MISKNRALVSVYIAPLFLTSLEDYQELLIIRGIVFFSRNIFISEIYHRVEPIIILL